MVRFFVDNTTTKASISMVVMHILKVQTGAKEIESPVFGTADFLRLQELFPDNPIWSARMSDMKNVYYPTLVQARALYDAMVKHYCNQDVSDQPYRTGGFVGGAPVISSLLSVFTEMIDFFEKELGFTCEAEAASIMAAKRKEYLEKNALKFAEYKQRILKECDASPSFRRVDAEKRALLEAKITEYNARLSECYQHPKVAMSVDQSYRSSTFKIEVATAVLNIVLPSERLSTRELMEKGWEKFGDDFEPDDYISAIVVIAKYCGITFPRP